MLSRPASKLELCDGYVQTVEGAQARVTLSEIARARSGAKLSNTFAGYFDVELPAFDPSDGVGEPYAMYVTGTQMAEVEVDTKSGDVRVLRMVAAHDVGKPVFVEGLIGQIEGGIAMGLGFALMEHFVPGQTTGFKQYQIPRTRDMPEIVTILVGGTGEPPDTQAKGVGECSNMVTAPAITNAIANAIGYRVLSLPARLPAGDQHADGTGAAAGVAGTSLESVAVRS
jgi:CO/xanthine dehydrogenase Mo-binding subunit